jgi:hypothetical protein
LGPTLLFGEDSRGVGWVQTRGLPGSIFPTQKVYLFIFTWRVSILTTEHKYTNCVAASDILVKRKLTTPMFTEF